MIVKGKRVMNRPTQAGESASTPGATPGVRRRRQRADAQQSIAAILRAAAEALNADPVASVEDIARAAGVTRQTVYAHFPSRDALIEAVTARATAEVAAAFETAGLDEAPPPVALTRLLDTGWPGAAPDPVLWHLPSVSPRHGRHPPGPVPGPMPATPER